MSVVANVAINVDSRNAVSKLREVQSQSQATERAVGGLGAALGKLAVAAAALQAARFVFVKTAELESQTRSLQVLTGSAEKAGQIIKELQQLGAVTPFTSTELIDSAKRLQAFGVETNKVVETTRRLADVSGATGAELQGLVTAYGQVQAKGRLQGEELLQFQERGVALQQVLREEYGLSGEEFQKALEKGRISAEAVEYAIQKLTDAGGKYANGAIAQSDTLNGRFSTLQDGVDELARVIGRTLSPVIKEVIVDITNLVNGFARGLQSMQDNYRIFLANLRGKTADELGSQISGINKLIATNQQQLAKVKPGGQTEQQVQAKIVELRKLRDSLQKDLNAKLGLKAPTGASTIMLQPEATSKAPPLLAGGGGSKGKTDAEKAAEKAAREAEKLAQEIQRSLELGDRLGTEFSRQVLLLAEANEIEQKRLQIQFDYEDRAKQITELKNAEQRTKLTQLNDEIRRLEIIDLQTEALKKQAEEAEKLFKKALGETEFGVAGEGTVASGLADAISKLKEELNPIKLQIDAIVNGATAIGTAFSTAFGEVITGAKSTQQALADAFKSIGQAFISMALEIIAKQMTLIILQTIFNALSGSGGGSSFAKVGKNLTGTGALKTTIPGLAVGGRASGGPVANNTPYMVGEQGPELFVPNSGGSIINNKDLRNAMTNGGGSSAGPVLNMSFETTSIGGVEYVSRDQLEQAMMETRRQASKDGAKRGMSMTLEKLRQSPQTRNSVGLR